MKQPFIGETLTVVPTAAYDDGPLADSDYTRTCWLPIAGPTTVLLVAQLAKAAWPYPHGPVDLGELGRCLGLRGTGNDSPLKRSLHRAVAYGLVKRLRRDAVGVHLHLPLVPLRHHDQLPESVRQSPEFRQWHDQSFSTQTPSLKGTQL